MVIPEKYVTSFSLKLPLLPVLYFFTILTSEIEKITHSKIESKSKIFAKLGLTFYGLSIDASFFQNNNF